MAAAVTARGPAQSDPLRIAVIVTLWLLLGLFVLYPLACLLSRAFSDDDGLTFGPIVSALGSPTHLRALRNSLLLATLVGVVGTAAGFLFAFTVERTDMGRGLRRLIDLVILLPLISPPFTTSIGFVFSFGPRGLITHGLFGMQNAQVYGWGSTLVLGFLGAGLALLVAFVAWERRAPAPMLPLRFFRSRAFAATNAVSLAMYFGVFGSIFFLAQFFQTAQGLSPLEAGLRTLPWTGMPMLVAPLAGLLSDRVGSRPLMVGGLALQAAAVAWIASISEPSLAYSRLVVPFVLGGMGMALVFAPAANAVLSAVRPSEAGQASGATNAIREVGGVFGVAVLASVFSGAGSYASPQAFNDGLVAAAWVGAAVLAAGALAALLVPRAAVARAAEPVPVAA